MKTGRSLTELAKEIERQVESKKDFIADTSLLTLLTSTEASKSGLFGYDLHLSGAGKYRANEVCHEQIGQRLQIPKTYYDRLKEGAPKLLEDNVNYWLMKQSGEKRMIRTLDGQARAFLSNRYRPLDNFDLANKVLPIIADLGCNVVSAELTDRRLYIKAVNARVQTDIARVGDVVQAGVVISNSEVGCGSVRVDPLVYRLSCRNGMIANDFSMRKFHIGRSGGDNENDIVSEFFKDETRQADDHAFFLKVGDIVQGVLTEAIFKQITDKMKIAAGIKIAADPVKCIETVSKKFGFNEDEKSGVLRFLIEGGDLSLYGVMNAVTRQSQEIEGYDRATDFERFGGQILEMPALVYAQS